MHIKKIQHKFWQRQQIQQYWGNELQTPGHAKPWRRAKVMFVGEGRAGKTSALRSLLNLPFSNTASTVGADMFDVSVQTAVGWSKQDSDVPEFHKVIARWAAWRNEHDGKLPPGVAPASASPGVCVKGLVAPKRDGRTAAASALATVSETKVEEAAAANPRALTPRGKSSAPDAPKMPDHVYDLVGSFAGKAADAVAFHIWDCGGQPVFNALHSLFMSGQVCEEPNDEQPSNQETTGSLTSFVVVFRASNFADEFSESCKRHLDILGNWLNLIALHARDAPVLLVGTHKDLLTAKQLDDAQRVVRGYVLELQVCAQKIIHIQPPDADTKGRFFFDLDNTARDLNNNASDEVVNELREKLEAVVQADNRKIAGLDGVPIKYVDVLLPLTCFKLLDDLKDDFKDRKVCSMKNDFFPRAASFGLGEKEARNLLPLLAKLGAILWFPHVKGADDLVVLHPQWVVTALTCIVREHNNNHNQLLDALTADTHDLRPDFRPEDVTGGIFPVELLRYVWSSDQKCYGPLRASVEEVDALERVLVQYGLVCEVTILRSTYAGLKPVRCFVVPSLLPEVDPARHMDGFYRMMRKDSRRQAFSCDFSETHFLPKHLFERLVSLVAKLFHEQDGEICESELRMAQGVASLSIGGLPLVMQLNTAAWRIVVTTSVCSKFPRGAMQVLQIVKAALQKLGHTTSHKVFLHSEWGEVDLNFLQDAQRKNKPFVSTGSQQSAPTAALFETWIEPKQSDVTKTAVAPSSSDVTTTRAVPSLTPVAVATPVVSSPSTAVVKGTRISGAPLNAPGRYARLPSFHCWFPQWKYRVNDIYPASGWEPFQLANSQLEQVYQEWIAGNPPDALYVVRRPSNRLSAVWTELESQGICSIRFEGGHYLSQVTALPADGSAQPSIELWRQDKDVNMSTGYPRMWGRLGIELNVQSPRRVQVRNQLSDDWGRVQHLLRSSLPDAELVGLERVVNHTVWSKFFKRVSIHRAKGGHVGLTSGGHKPISHILAGNKFLASGVQMLWHATNCTDEICSSDVGFDLQYSHVHKFKQSLLDLFGWGGHIYGYGAYFAVHAIYSHWWMNNFWKNKHPDAKKGTYLMILAYVLTGKSKDYGPRKADDLIHAPGDFDSVCGTEMDQNLFPIQKAAKNQSLASDLLSFGRIYGRQFALFRPDQIYPAYVVKYRMNPTEAQAHRASVVCTAKVTQFSVKSQAVWQCPGPGIALVVVGTETLDVKDKRVFDPWSREHGDRDAAGICEYIANKIAPEDVVLLAVSFPRSYAKISRRLSLTKVFGALRSIGSSRHHLSYGTLYVCIGCKIPSRLEGPVRESCDASTASVRVDMRAVRYKASLERGTRPEMRSLRVFRRDLLPVVWQHRTKDFHGKHDQPVWQNYLDEHSQILTEGYLTSQQRVQLSSYREGKLIVWDVDLKAMHQSRGVKGRQVRCLNLHGESLRPLNEVDILVSEKLAGRDQDEISAAIEKQYCRRIRTDYDALTEVMSSVAGAKPTKDEASRVTGVPLSPPSPPSPSNSRFDSPSAASGGAVASSHSSCHPDNETGPSSTEQHVEISRSGDRVCPAADVIAWLTTLDLERYANAFYDAGYEDLTYISDMSLEDVLEIEGMKKPHAKRIYKAVSNLNDNL